MSVFTLFTIMRTMSLLSARSREVAKYLARSKGGELLANAGECGHQKCWKTSSKSAKIFQHRSFSEFS